MSDDVERISFPCNDCAVDTIPFGRAHEWYMVHDAVWAAAGMKNDDGMFLCIACLECRLSRSLSRADFTDAHVNKKMSARTWLLRDRLRRDRKPFETTPLGRWKR